ncbi:MAG: hypothetical protein MMC33_001519 [Icmadophila ericetorum]|nr:hypothetical protein [Icmadophila ericetorum]
MEKQDMQAFEYIASPSKVIFGSGVISKLPSELTRQNLSRALLITGPRGASQVNPIIELLGSKLAGTFSHAAQHTPLSVTNTALRYASSLSPSIDSIVSFGGGSAVGLGKALSVRLEIPHICIVTTYSGSEMTSLVGETGEDGVKRTRSDPRILPGCVFYDVDFTVGMGVAMSAVSGVNAIAHAVEALYARNTNPIVALIAKEGVKALAKALPEIVEDPTSPSARWNALYGAWLCGYVLGSVSVGLHHKLCHTIGGSFNMPHAETHTIVLPHALSYNAPAVPKAMKELVEVLPGSDGDAIKGLNVLLSKLKVKRALKDFGMKEEDIDRAAEIATMNPYWNPREIEKRPLREIIRRCWAGEDARADL